MARESVPDALGLPRLLEGSGALNQLRGHAQRIAEDIKAAAEETGGKPARSGRYLDATAIVYLVDQIEAVSNGTFTHTVAESDVS